MNKKRLLLSILFISLCGTLLFLLTKKLRDKDAVNTTHLTSKQEVEKTIHLTKEKAYFIPLKIQGFSLADIPYLEVQIENTKFDAKIDLGFEGMISLPIDIIDKLHTKTFVKQTSTYGLTAKTYKNDVYEIPEIQIGSVTFFPVLAEKMNEELEHDIDLGKKETSEEIPLDKGTIGWRLFQNFNVLLDCEHSLLTLCDSLETLKKKGYPVESFTEVPLLLNRGGIEFEAITEAGTLRCILDTGSTLNMLNKDLETFSSDHMIFTPDNTSEYPMLNPDNKSLLTFDYKDYLKLPVFKIGEKEYGPITFNRIKTPMAIDAIIGMEFIQSNLIFIDFANSKLYFYEIPEKVLEEGTENKN